MVSGACAIRCRREHCSRRHVIPLLYVVEPGAQVKLKGGRLRVEKKGELLAHAPLDRVSAVVLAGAAGISTPALRRLADAGVPVSLVRRGGRPVSFCQPTTANHAGDLSARRLGQYRLLLDPALRLAAARRIVRRKLAAMRSLLERAGGDAGWSKRSNRSATESNTRSLKLGSPPASVRRCFAT